MYRIWYYDQFASSCICLIDFDTISLYFNPFAIHDIPQHGLAWNKLGIHGRPWPTQTSEIFWTSFFRWWEVGFLVALVEGSVCFGNFGGQDKGQWYLLGPTPGPLQTWGVWYFFWFYSGMMWDVFLVFVVFWASILGRLVPKIDLSAAPVLAPWLIFLDQRSWSDVSIDIFPFCSGPFWVFQRRSVDEYWWLLNECVAVARLIQIVPLQNWKLWTRNEQRQNAKQKNTQTYPDMLWLSWADLGCS